jgi:hypothetical protein
MKLPKLLTIAVLSIALFTATSRISNIKLAVDPMPDCFPCDPPPDGPGSDPGSAGPCPDFSVPCCPCID